MTADETCFHERVHAERQPYALRCQDCGAEVFAEPGGGYTDASGEPWASMERAMAHDMALWDEPVACKVTITGPLCDMEPVTGSDGTVWREATR
jgi:hypothetical protein